jgi:uncharacterized protein
MSQRARALGGSLAILLIGASLDAAAAANEPIQLEWGQLIPVAESGDGMTRAEIPTGVVQHGQLTYPVEVDERMTQVVTDYDGKQVRMPGYVVPIDFIGANVKQFLLVPYVGACIHVPPPPPNQIVYVTSEEGVEVRGLFEPVWVTGTFNTASISNELADIGYQIEADAVEPYEE